MDVDSSNNNYLLSGGQKVQLKNLLERIQTIDESEDTGLNAVKGVCEILEDLNNLENENPARNVVDDASETVMDAMVVNSASNLVLKCVDAVSSNKNEYDGNEFAERLIAFMNPEDPENLTAEDYFKLLPFANRIIREAPPFAPLYGAYKFDVNPPPVKEKQKRIVMNKAKIAETKLTKVTKPEKGGVVIDDKINFMTSVLAAEYKKNGNKPIGYYKYVIDTSDFGESVQNIFYTSFLIRDGKARLDVDKYHRPNLSPVDKSELVEFKKKNGENTQVITKFSMAIWEQFKGGEGYLQHYKNKKKIIEY